MKIAEMDQPSVEQPSIERPENARLRTGEPASRGTISFRAFVLGLVLACGLAALNCWMESVLNVHFLGGVHMPFGSVFILMFFILAINVPLRALNRGLINAPGGSMVRKLAPPFTPAELLCIYLMTLFAALISTPGTDNFFLTVGPALFYFSTPENGWAKLFYEHVPRHFAPGWNGKTFEREVIQKLYTGGISPADVPWHAWTAMIIAWCVFLLLIYSLLFFTSLLFRRQWIENEALAFPLVALPLQMVDGDINERPPARAFWGNRTMWIGFSIAAFVHMLFGLNHFFPDWPAIAAFQGGSVWIAFPDAPWNALGAFNPSIFLGAIGLAYLLTREVSLSFWVFFLLTRFESVLALQAGFNPGTLPKDTYQGNPTFIMWQSVGGWMMMAALLAWPVRRYAAELMRQCFGSNRTAPGEPFSPRFMVGGTALTLAGLLFWSWFSGLSLWLALAFLAMHLAISLVLARLVVEGGFLFPQATFSPLEVMTTGMFGAPMMGAGNLTRLSFIQPVTLSDPRPNLLPAFLHTFKIAHELRLDRTNIQRLLMCIACAVVAALGVTVAVTIMTLYHAGGLSAYGWFSQDGPKGVFAGAATAITTKPTPQLFNWFWAAIGASVVLLMMMARSRFLWFPLHPLGFLVAAGYPIQRLWFSFFIGWTIKTLVMRFGGSDTNAQMRPFMIGMIFGNVAAMVLWMIVGFKMGSQIGYFPG